MTRKFYALAALSMAVAACKMPPDNRPATYPPDTVSMVDISKYVGLWYEIARYPNFFEDTNRYTCVGVTAFYEVQTSEEISVENTCYKDTLDGEVQVAKGVGRIVDPSNAKLKVRFAPAWVPFADGDYWILALTDDYGAVLVGEPEGRFLWVLSRTPQLDDEIYQSLIDVAESQGFDTRPLQRTPQPGDPAP